MIKLRKLTYKIMKILGKIIYKGKYGGTKF